jgi:hypothetical protein
VYQSQLEHAAAWLAIPDTNKIKGKNTGLVTYTGTWTDDTPPQPGKSLSSSAFEKAAPACAYSLHSSDIRKAIEP